MRSDGWRTLLALSGLVLVVFISACQEPPDPVPDPPMLRNSIVFVSNRDGTQQVYVLDLSSRVVVIPLPLPEAGVPSGPAVSPDGRKIVLALKGIWVMNVDGSEAVKVSPFYPFDQEPSWSPDGNRILFTSPRDGNREIYVMDSNGQGQTRLTSDAGADLNPRWSPDGDQIVFTSNRSGTYNIWVMDADGANPTQLTTDPEGDGAPDWSHDGSRIVFSSNRGMLQPIIMDRDGGNQVTVPIPTPTGAIARWLPGDTLLVVATYPGAPATGFDLFLARPDGALFENLTNAPGSDNQPSPSP